ncbi:hypothetical protein [Variovorax sp. 54]|uniref:hypothetical protein n=1 Tax=Variovorax sp. 54 TaxID=2035212 RepID=UPI00211F1AD1|nr:hypothetical protein [Variovorax sp. 54]
MQQRQAATGGLDVGQHVAGDVAVEVLEQDQRALALGQVHRDGMCAVACSQRAGHGYALGLQVREQCRFVADVRRAARTVGAQARDGAAAVDKLQSVDVVEAAPQQLARPDLAEVVGLRHLLCDGGARGRGLGDLRGA